LFLFLDEGSTWVDIGLFFFEGGLFVYGAVSVGFGFGFFFEV